MNRIKYVFSPESEKYDGIRPINIYAMRFIYGLMASFLAFDVWSYIIGYDQVWDPDEAMNWSVWGAFSLFAVLGIFKTVFPVCVRGVTSRPGPQWTPWAPCLTNAPG